MLIEIAETGPDRWKAGCQLCGWRSKPQNTEVRARHAGAQHLWDKRGMDHARLGDTCPTDYKKRHMSEQAAQAHIKDLYRAGKGNPDYEAYKCRCGWWHIGHAKERFQKRINRAVHVGNYRREMIEKRNQQRRRS